MAADPLNFFAAAPATSPEHHHKVRFLQLVRPDGPVELYIADQPRVVNLLVGEITGYIPLVWSRPDQPLVLQCKTGRSHVIARYNIKQLPTEPCLIILSENGKVSIFPDKQRCPNPGKANLRVINAIPGAAGVVVGVGSGLYGQVGYLDVASSPYIRVPLGARRISFGGSSHADLHFVSGAIYTLVMLPSAEYSFSQDNVPSECESLQPDFELSRFMGSWYQVASIKSPLESAHRLNFSYTHLNDGIKILCSGYGPKWAALSQLDGYGIPISLKQPAIWSVGFGPDEEAAGLGPNFLVHHVVYDSHALIGSPDRSQMLILGRKVSLKADIFATLLQWASELGYDKTQILIDPEAVL